MIEICDISTALKDLRKSPLSRTKRSKQAKKYSFYISVMKSDLSKATAQFPGIQVIVSGINEIFSGLGLRQIIL